MNTNRPGLTMTAMLIANWIVTVTVVTSAASSFQIGVANWNCPLFFESYGVANPKTKYCHGTSANAQDTKRPANQLKVEIASTDSVVHLSFDGSVNDKTNKLQPLEPGKHSFVRGLVGQAIQIQSNDDSANLKYDLASLGLTSDKDFSLQFWVRTTINGDNRMVLLATKKYPDNGLNSQKQQGWMFGCFNGTWAWNMGSGRRRISYDRTNGQFMPINDGRWHQLSMTHSSREGLVRLYLDGKNMVTYNIQDSGEFEFGNKDPLTIGWSEAIETRPASSLPVFTRGAEQLQKLVDEFNQLGLPALTNEEFRSLVSRPARLFEEKIAQLRKLGDPKNKDLLQRLESANLKPIEAISRRLMASPYTVHQSRYYNDVARLFKLYQLQKGRVVIDQATAERFAKQEILAAPSFDLDEFKVWERVVSADEILKSYSRFFQPVAVNRPVKLTSLKAACWNIYHGGLHGSVEDDGWDAREVIIELLRREQIDLIMMQETYSAGDYIAAELGFYYATTIDWDNMHQGPNISVLSRYPIEQVFVPPKSAFMNVAAKVSLSKTQDIWVMSNWYGMRNFEDVYQFHESRFNQTDSLPILFAGDFNAIPDGDRGDSLASRKLLAAGFTDAYRELFPDVKKYPGSTHRSNRRIDQLYYKGKGLRNTETQVFSTWPTRFPSDHYLIKSVFELDYSTRK